MAFYFALLNVSKKDNKEKKEKHSIGERRHHRRHSIASVESPLLDYRLLPRPQLLSDDLVITNDMAQQMEMSSSSSHHNSNHDPITRRSRGSARASKWVRENHLSSSGRQLQPSTSCISQWGTEGRNAEPPPPSSSHPPHPPNPQPLARSKPMVFEGQKSTKGDGGKKSEVTKEKDKEKERKSKMRKKKSDDEEVGGGQKKSIEENKRNGRKKSENKNQDPRGLKGNKKGGDANEKVKVPTETLKPKKQLGPTRKVQPGPSASIPQSSIAARRAQKDGGQSNSNGLKPLDYHPQPTRRRLVNEYVSQQKTGTATDESGRSSSQVSNESRTPRRDSSPESTEEETDKNSLLKKELESDVALKLSGVSMSSRASEPRLKKVTFESSTYVISNSFLGEGAGKVLVVRRNSGSAVRRVSNDWSSNRGWWDRKDGQDVKAEVEAVITDNQANKEIEKSQTRSILRRGLIRRRSTSDKSRLLAYRNSGFLSNSQERTPESTSLSASRMTVSVDCQRYQ